MVFFLKVFAISEKSRRSLICEAFPSLHKAEQPNSRAAELNEGMKNEK